MRDTSGRCPFETQEYDIILVTLTQGMSFGEQSFLARTPSLANVRTLQYCELMNLNYADFEVILGIFPELQIHVMGFQREQLAKYKREIGKKLNRERRMQNAETTSNNVSDKLKEKFCRSKTSKLTAQNLMSAKSLLTEVATGKGDRNSNMTEGSNRSSWRRRSSERCARLPHAIPDALAMLSPCMYPLRTRTRGDARDALACWGHLRARCVCAGTRISSSASSRTRAAAPRKRRGWRCSTRARRRAP